MTRVCTRLGMLLLGSVVVIGLTAQPVEAALDGCKASFVNNSFVECLDLNDSCQNQNGTCVAVNTTVNGKTITNCECQGGAARPEAWPET